MVTTLGRAIGPDLSKYDLQFDPRRSAHEIDFVIQRASYRLTKDEGFDNIYPGVIQVPIRLAYHYLNSDKPWRDQANFFLNVVDGKGFHALVCDFESSYNVMSQKFALDCWEFLRYITVQTGKRAILYTNRYHYMDWLIPAGKTYGLNWNDVDYWQAQYFIPPNPDGNPVVPVGRTGGWDFWQYTSAGGGVEWGAGRPISLDLNVFNGTPSDLRRWLGISENPVPDPEPDPTPDPNPVVSFEFKDKDGVTYVAKDVELTRV